MFKGCKTQPELFCVGVTTTSPLAKFQQQKYHRFSRILSEGQTYSIYFRHVIAKHNNQNALEIYLHFKIYHNRDSFLIWTVFNRNFFVEKKLPLFEDLGNIAWWMKKNDDTNWHYEKTQKERKNPSPEREQINLLIS